MAKKNWPIGFLFLLISGVICYVLSMGNPHLDQMEMGGMINVYGPGIFTLLIIIIFLVIMLAGGQRHWLMVSLILSFINILMGLYLHNYY